MTSIKLFSFVKAAPSRNNFWSFLHSNDMKIFMCIYKQEDSELIKYKTGISANLKTLQQTLGYVLVDVINQQFNKRVLT